jgi:hypothetical protein
MPRLGALLSAVLIPSFFLTLHLAFQLHTHIRENGPVCARSLLPASFLNHTQPPSNLVVRLTVTPSRFTSDFHDHTTPPASSSSSSSSSTRPVWGWGLDAAAVRLLFPGAIGDLLLLELESPARRISSAFTASRGSSSSSTRSHDDDDADIDEEPVAEFFFTADRGFLFLSEESRKLFNITLTHVAVSSELSDCFGGPLSSLMIEGMDEFAPVVAHALQGHPRARSGFLYDTSTSRTYRLTPPASEGRSRVTTLFLALFMGVAFVVVARHTILEMSRRFALFVALAVDLLYRRPGTVARTASFIVETTVLIMAGFSGLLMVGEDIGRTIPTAVFLTGLQMYAGQAMILRSQASKDFFPFFLLLSFTAFNFYILTFNVFAFHRIALLLLLHFNSSVLLLLWWTE